MIAIVRLMLIGIFIILSTFVILLVCLLRPRNAKNAYFAAKLYSKAAWLLGVKITLQGQENIPSTSCVYVSNHQSNYDVFLLTAAVVPGTVSIGKKSILYFPFFGLMYWLSGNIFIDRSNKINAMHALQKTKQKMLRDNISVWLFPEGTRNYGQGLKPFKTGAFYLARNAQLPLVPIVVNNYYPDFRLNRLNNGEITIKYLPVIEAKAVTSQPLRQVVADTYARMNAEIASLNKP